MFQLPPTRRWRLRLWVAPSKSVFVPLQGSLPLDGKGPSRALPCHLQPYGSSVLLVEFYFPYPMEAAGQFPATVSSSEGQLLTATTPQAALQVLAVLPPAPPATGEGFNWLALSQGASDAEVIEYLKSGNLGNGEVDLDKIAWRARRRCGPVPRPSVDLVGFLTLAHRPRRWKWKPAGLPVLP